MGEMTVRPERPGDARSIRSVTKAAFSGVPYSDGSEPSIPGALRAAGDLAFSAVAEKARRLIGHVALSPVTIGSTGTGWYGLGPLSVLPDHQRQGTGTALMAAALDWLDRERAAGCVLVGDPGYYGRFGFLSDGRVTYAGVDAAYVLRKLIAGPDTAGEAVFPPAFGAAG